VAGLLDRQTYQLILAIAPGLVERTGFNDDFAGLAIRSQLARRAKGARAAVIAIWRPMAVAEARSGIAAIAGQALKPANTARSAGPARGAHQASLETRQARVDVRATSLPLSQSFGRPA
jgi:hypothetical protein